MTVETSDCTQSCPHCGRIFEWDWCSDYYPDTNQRAICNGDDTIILSTCPNDGAVIAILLLDEFGLTVYTP